MKIKVADLEPNPFRHIDKYPIDRAKVEALKTSIKEKSFWDNILVRPHGNKYQIAYGHHRWIALQELGIKEIDVPTRDIDDATILQIMAEENLNWSTSPAVMTQTILTAKEYLDAELAKYETWEDVRSGVFARAILDIKTGQEFAALKKTGVGRETLVKFLGGNWTLYKVRHALLIIKDENLDQKAVCEIPTMEQARVFRESVKKHEIPKPTQKKIAKKIAKEGVGKRDIPDLVAEHSLKPVKREKPEPEPLPMLDDVIENITRSMNELYSQLSHVKGNIKSIQSSEVYDDFLLSGRDLLAITEKIFGKESQNVKKKEGKRSITCS